MKRRFIVFLYAPSVSGSISSSSYISGHCFRVNCLATSSLLISGYSSSISGQCV